MKNFRIEVLTASKRVTPDNYENGCSLESKERTVSYRPIYDTIVDAFRDVVNDPSLEQKDIRPISPNIFCDVKGGGTRVVKDNEARGHYRCCYDRMENKRGRTPTAQEDADFNAGKIDLLLADYEVIFRIVSVGLDENALAEFLGVSSPG